MVTFLVVQRPSVDLEYSNCLDTFLEKLALINKRSAVLYCFTSSTFLDPLWSLVQYIVIVLIDWR